MSTSKKSSSTQRTIIGTIVHVIGLLSGLFGTGLVYLLSNEEFTKSNAEHALNWQIFIFVSSVVLGLMAFGLETVSDWFVIIAALGVLILGLLNVAFCLWATVKAIEGDEWKYPLTPTFL